MIGLTSFLIKDLDVAILKFECFKEKKLILWIEIKKHKANELLSF